MTDEDRQKLCADLRDPWAVTIEELAELAAVAADEIDRLAKAAAAWKGRAEEGWKIANEYAAVVDQLKAELARDPPPASTTHWWARSKRTEGAE